MKSRMDRYYNDDEQFVGRSKKNEQLYREKDYSVYSSNETIIDTNNEIDITKLKDIIKSREDYQRAKSYRNMLNDKKFDYDDIPYEVDDYEEKDYDINALLEKVKNEKENKDGKDEVRKLRNTQYDILSNLDIKRKSDVTPPSEEIKKEELQDLIDSITHKSEDKENINETEGDPFDLLSELKSSDNTMVTDPIDKIEEVKDQKETTQKIEPEKDNDDETSFYSDSFTFSKKDFEGFKDLQKDVKSGNKLIKVLIFILVLIIIAMAVLILDYFYHFLPFM